MNRIYMVFVLGALALGACKKSSGGDIKLKQINDALIAAGFKLDTFHPADARTFSAQSCAAGTLNGVDAVVCEYSSPQATALGKKAGEDWVAQAMTGTVLANGSTMLALADRGRVDPNGKTIHKISQAYTKTH
jgi:hypothetical protein